MRAAACVSAMGTSLALHLLTREEDRPSSAGVQKRGHMRKHGMRFVLALLVSGCLVLAAKVTTDYSHSTDFAQYKTYSWLKVDAGNSLWADRIQKAVDSQLNAKGLTEAPSGGDIAIAAFGSRQNQQQLETFYDTFGGGWGWRGFGDGTATTTVQNIPVGSLNVDMFDGHTKKLVWRGSANDVLSDKPEKNEQKMDKSVADMFKHFPPPPKD